MKNRGFPRRLYLVDNDGRVLFSRSVNGLRGEQIHALETRLRAAYGVDEPDSGIVLRDSINDPPR